MTAWVKFINKTALKAVYISVDDRFIPIPVILSSRYILTNAGSVTVDIFDGHFRLVKSMRLSIFPSRVQTIILY